MKPLILYLFLFLSSQCYSQITHYFSIDDSTFSITFSKNDNNYNFNIFKIGNNSNIKSFTLPKLDFLNFRNLLLQSLDSLTPSLSSTLRDSTYAKNEVREIFYAIVANIDVVDDLNYAPIAGTLKVGEEVNFYIDYYQSSKALASMKFKIENIQIVFQEGFIQDIIVDGEIKGGKFDKRKMRFSNFYGIGFSSKQNFRNLGDINLYYTKITGSYDGFLINSNDFPYDKKTTDTLKKDANILNTTTILLNIICDNLNKGNVILKRSTYISENDTVSINKAIDISKKAIENINNDTANLYNTVDLLYNSNDSTKPKNEELNKAVDILIKNKNRLIEINSHLKIAIDQLKNVTIKLKKDIADLKIITDFKRITDDLNKNYKTLDGNITTLKNDIDYFKKDDDLFKKDKLKSFHIKLGEVIQEYNFNNDLYTNDFSPANVKVAINGGESLTLYKDKTYKILEARVFSDFLGFDSNKPNGLIQFELEKHFNLNTYRKKFCHYSLRVGFGNLEYLKFVGGISKVEKNNRNLTPDMKDEITISFSGDTILNNKRYTTPIDIISHQTWNVGLILNGLFFDIPLIKSQLHINLGFKFNQTKVIDSLRTFGINKVISSKSNEYNLNYWLFYPEVKLHVLPETRYGIYASWRPKYLKSLSDRLEYSGPQNLISGNMRSNISNWINEFELLGYLYTNQEKQNGKLFIKWILNTEFGYNKNNFTQFQLGYSFYILGRGKINTANN